MKRVITWQAKVFVGILILLPPLVLFMIYGSAATLYQQVLQRNEIIVFEKGDFYMWGVCIGLMSLGFHALIENWFSSLYTGLFVKISVTLALVGLILIFTLPQIVHVYVANFTKTQGYERCEFTPRQTGRFQKKLYVKETIGCENIPEEYLEK